MAKTSGRATYLRGTPAERFWPKVDKNGPVPDYAPHLGPCWLWTAALTHGYGTFKLEPGKPTTRAHRFAYEDVVGPIPDGLHLDHLCRVTACVRPDHLEPVTLEENTRRGFVGQINAARLRAITHCLRGHEYTPENTGLDSFGKRFCRTCSKARARAKWTGRLACTHGHPFADETTAEGRNRSCWTCKVLHRLGVDPASLDPAAAVELAADAGIDPDAFCANGHEMTEVNLRVTPSGKRVCRQCARDRSQRSRVRKRGAAA